MTLEQQAQELVTLLQEPMNLDRWTLRLVMDGEMDSRAACDSQPEYREAEIRFDFNSVKTGDDLAELAVHEMTHPHIEPLSSLAVDLANALADSSPEYMRDGLRKLLLERVRWVEEQVTTDVGHVLLKNLRRPAILATPLQS